VTVLRNQENMGKRRGINHPVRNCRRRVDATPLRMLAG
jgi:hypothetical protein